MTDKSTPATPAADASDDAGQAADQAVQESSQEVAPDPEALKQKFRDALDRKNAAHHGGQSAGGRGGDKISGAHGPAGGRRSFRRKSG